MKWIVHNLTTGAAKTVSDAGEAEHLARVQRGRGDRVEVREVKQPGEHGEPDWNDRSDPRVRQLEREEREDFENEGCDTAADLEDDERVDQEEEF